MFSKYTVYVVFLTYLYVAFIITWMLQGDLITAWA